LDIKRLKAWMGLDDDALATLDKSNLVVHRDVVNGYIKGRTIECRDKSSGKWSVATTPVFKEKASYRIQPETVESFKARMFSKYADEPIFIKTAVGDILEETIEWVERRV